MDKNKNYRIIHRIVVGCLRSTIKAHGPVTSRFIGSAAKRIASNICSHKSPKRKKQKSRKSQSN